MLIISDGIFNFGYNGQSIEPSNFGYLILGNMFILGISAIVESQLGIQARNTKKLGHTLDNAM